MFRFSISSWNGSIKTRIQLRFAIVDQIVIAIKDLKKILKNVVTAVIRFFAVEF